MTVTSTLPCLVYGTRSPLFVIRPTTRATGAPTMKIFSGILLILSLAYLTLTAATWHHVYR